MGQALDDVHPPPGPAAAAVFSPTIIDYNAVVVAAPVAGVAAALSAYNDSTISSTVHHVFGERWRRLVNERWR